MGRPFILFVCLTQRLAHRLTEIPKARTEEANRTQQEHVQDLELRLVQQQKAHTLQANQLRKAQEANERLSVLAAQVPALTHRCRTLHEQHSRAVGHVQHLERKLASFIES